MTLKTLLMATTIAFLPLNAMAEPEKWCLTDAGNCSPQVNRNTGHINTLFGQNTARMADIAENTAAIEGLEETVSEHAAAAADSAAAADQSAQASLSWAGAARIAEEAAQEHAAAAAASASSIQESKDQIDQNTAAINSTESRLDAAENRVATSSQAGYEHNAAVTDLKVTEERALSTFIRNTDVDADGKPITPPDSELQKRKDAAIAEKQAVVDTLYTDPYKNKDSITDNTAAIGDNTAAIESNTDSIHVVVDRISAAFGNLDEATINARLEEVSVNTAAIANNTKAIADNTSRINTLEEDVDGLKSGVAMAIAIANAPIVSNGDNKFSLSGGVGYYEDKFALSLKSAFMPTNSIAITASVASDLSENYAFGAGVGIGF